MEAHCQVATLKEKLDSGCGRFGFKRRMTQERFAETLDISVDFLSLIERGRNSPSFETLEIIAKYLSSLWRTCLFLEEPSEPY